MLTGRCGSAGFLGGDPPAVLLFAHVPVEGVGCDHRDQGSEEHVGSLLWLSLLAMPGTLRCTQVAAQALVGAPQRRELLLGASACRVGLLGARDGGT
jgi:hypothetical protein